MKALEFGEPRKRNKMAPDSVCVSQLKLLVTFIVIIIQLGLLLDAGQVKRSRARTAHQSDINSGCDLLFAANMGAQDFCQCRDSGPIDPAPGGIGEPQPPAGPNDDLSSPAVAISQLDCRHDNASELVRALSRALAGESSPKFKLDYLNIQTNVTYGIDELKEVGWHNHGLAHVDQLTATLEVTGSARASLAENWLSSLGTQLFAPDRLQSLTLVIIENGPSQQVPEGIESNSLKLNPLLEKLSSLSRLEISLLSADNRRANNMSATTTLELDSISLRAQSHSLQWLNLASNSKLNLISAPLARLNALEYLNLESNGLSSFHLHDHFTSQSHLNLSSLNLARNELSSLERDLFCCSARSRAFNSSKHLFRLPSLSQLDLSHNLFISISAHEARSILMSLPQLANLYLQHNQIVHLNLNALLGSAGLHDHLVGLSTFEDNHQDQIQVTTTTSDQTSKLEFIDLSHNELLQLTAFSHAYASDKQPNGPRIRSINLAHNRLRRPISLINQKLVNLLVFAESLEFKRRPVSDSSSSNPVIDLNSIGTIFDLTGAGGENITSSLCDYLSVGQSVDRLATGESTDESSLTELLLDHNSLVRLELGDLAGASCQGLETLALNDNSIAHIAPGALDSLTRLQTLDLSANHLTELPVALFDHLSELQVLNLARNKLIRIISLPPLIHLQELYLDDNALDNWQVSFSSASTLRILDLSHNKLAHLTPNAFSHLNELTHLNLEGNKQLKEFNWHVLFRAPAAASSSDVSHNELRLDLPPDHKSDKKTKRRKLVKTKAQRRRSARSSSARMQDDDQLEHSQSSETKTTVLDLKDNRLASFGPSVVSGAASSISCDLLTTTLRHIRVLDLSQNSLRELGNNSFACFHHLELLDLSSNQLRALNEFALEQLTRLRHCNLANNYLVHVNPLPGRLLLHRLHRLDLSQNQLSSLSLSIAPGPSELEHLDLSDNYNLKLDSSELLALLRASSTTLRHLKLARIASIWTNSPVNESSLQFELELDQLDLGQVSRVDGNFCQYLVSGRLKVEKLALCPAGQENDFKLNKLLQHTKLGQLDLSRCQLTSSMLKRALDDDPHATGGGGGGGGRESNATITASIRIDLSHNKLSEWPSPLVSSIAHLDLSHNKLSGRLFRPKEQTHFFAHQLAQLEFLNLSSNSLTSVCGEEKHDGDDKQCKQVVAQMPRLRHLDMSHNKLTALPSDLFTQWQHLEMVWLGYNRLALVAPPHSGRSQHLSIASSLRMLDLSFIGPATSYLSSPTGQVEVSSQFKGDLLPVATRGLIIYKDEERAVIGCSHLSDFIRAAQRRSSVHSKTAITKPWAGYASGSEADYFGRDDQSSDQVESRQEARLVTCPGLRELKLDNATWSGLNLSAHQLESQTSSQVALSSTRNQIRTIGEINSRLTPRSSGRVIYLDLSRNALESSLALDEICAHFPNLQTLEATHQTNLQEVSVHHLARDDAHSRTCARLAYVNLSNNKLRLIKLGAHVNRPLDSVLVLMLDHNYLQDFGQDLLGALPNLRHLDLRSNRIAHVAALDILTSALLASPLLDMVLDQHRPPVNVHRYEVQLTRDMSALKIGTTTPTANETLGLVEVSSLAGARRPSFGQLNQTSHVLRFCTLNRTELYKVCLTKTPDGTPVERPPVCFALKPPPRGPSCTTNIEEPQHVANNRQNSSETRTESLMSSGDQMSSTINKTTEDSPHDDDHDDNDPVLSFIDQLKRAWLRVKQFDLGAYLAQVSQVKQDSVLMTINGQHPIYTLAMIKLGLVLAALCVILLSIAMFALLTATVIGGSGGGGGAGASSKRQKLRRQNKVSDHESIESNYDRATSRAGRGEGHAAAAAAADDDDDETTTTSGGRGSGATKSRDTSEGSRYSRHTSATTSGGSSASAAGSSNLDTVREADNGSLAGAPATSGGNPNQQLFLQQNCSTPSSSLAPSSVETGETMQAVDSLQSCSLTRAQRQEIYDSQRTLTEASGHVHYFNSVDQYQHKAADAGVQVSPAPPVATVMRMVKSSTFDGVGASTGPNNYAGDLLYEAQQQHDRLGYGTLRNQHQLHSAGRNYSSLARPQPSRRGFGPNVTAIANNRLPVGQQQRQIYVPVQSMSFGGGGGGGGGELDPATLSLLSLNSQLSGGGGGGGHGANNGSGRLPGGEQVAPVPATSLCQYHTRQQAMQRARDQQQQQDQHSELLLLAGELQHRHHSSAASAATTTIGGNGTLFELEEELLQVDNQLADWRGACEHEEADYPLAPPPPPPPPSL